VAATTTPIPPAPRTLSTRYFPPTTSPASTGERADVFALIPVAEPSTGAQDGRGAPGIQWIGAELLDDADVSFNVKRALSIVLSAIPVLSVAFLAAPAAKAAESADQCVRLRESQETKGLALDVDNNCDRALSCAVSWTVSCQTESGRITRSAKEGARFVVAASQTGRAFASTKSCGDNWKIEDISWDCATPK
jgi:hypothetical protein